MCHWNNIQRGAHSYFFTSDLSSFKRLSVSVHLANAAARVRLSGFHNSALMMPNHEGLMSYGNQGGREQSQQTLPAQQKLISTSPAQLEALHLRLPFSYVCLKSLSFEFLARSSDETSATLLLWSICCSLELARRRTCKSGWACSGRCLRYGHREDRLCTSSLLVGSLLLSEASLRCNELPQGMPTHSFIHYFAWQVQPA